MKILRDDESTSEWSSGAKRERWVPGLSMRERPVSAKTEAKLSGLSAMHSRGKLTSLTPSKIISSMVVPEPWQRERPYSSLERLRVKMLWRKACFVTVLKSTSTGTPGVRPDSL